MPPSLQLRWLERSPMSVTDDRLEFAPGVNVIVGRPNAGKSKWLQMLDYLLGDSDPPERAFPPLHDKYEGVAGGFVIGGNEVVIAREWKRRGARTKVSLNDRQVPVEDFSSNILEMLGVPRLHYPRGNPYAETTWPELSFRVLYRHMFRKDDYWGDLVPKQPDSEFNAALLQFLGLAEGVFPERLGDLVAKRREVTKLEARRDQFEAILRELSRDLVTDPGMMVSPTEDSIDQRIAALRKHASDLEERRHAIVAAIQQGVEIQRPGPPVDLQLADERAALFAEKEALLAAASQTSSRLNQLRPHLAAVENEIGRLERAASAGEVLGGLRITTCPACDQPVLETETTASSCFLCGQPRTPVAPDEGAGKARVSFELEQLKAERSELRELVNNFESEAQASRMRIRSIEERIAQVDVAIRPARQAAASLLPPDLAALDAERGGAQENINQLERLRSALSQRQEIIAAIDAARADAERLGAEVSETTGEAHFEQASEWIQSGINTYLNSLNSAQVVRWTEPEMQVRVRERSTRFTVAGAPWSAQLGATLKCYFFMAYHYALLRLTPREGCHYPGFAVIDFPPTLADPSALRDKENFLVAPFIDLLGSMSGEAQLIVAGSAFSDLRGASRIELSSVWA